VSGGGQKLALARARATEAGARAFERLPWHDVVTAALERERFSAAGLLAGGLAYRLFFWLVPLGLTLAALLSFWVESDRAGLEEAAREFGLGGAAANAAADAIAESARSRWYFLVAGVGLLGWFGAGVVRALNVAHAVAWRLRPDKLRQPYLKGGVFTVLVVAILLLSSGAAIVREYDPGPGLVVTLSLVVVYLGAFVWGSSHLPHRAEHWTAFVPGAVLVAVGTQVVHLVAVYYLAPKLGRSSELYGALGSATVILLWLYLVARLVVAGAFANAALWEHRRAAEEGFTPSG
jgi:membrane protein